MTREQINYLLKTHESQRDFALQMLRRLMTELEAQGRETEWTNRYLYHKWVVDSLKQEKAEDK